MTNDSYISAEEFFGEEEAKARKDKLRAKDGCRKLYYCKPSSLTIVQKRETND